MLIASVFLKEFRGKTQKITIMKNKAVRYILAFEVILIVSCIGVFILDRLPISEMWNSNNTLEVFIICCMFFFVFLLSLYAGIKVLNFKK